MRPRAVIASEAKQSIVRRRKSGLLRGACHRARICATRWLAMTKLLPPEQDMKVIGLAGWSGAGKTTLLTRAIPQLQQQGLRVSVIKHAHHAFDVDVPG